MLKLGYKASAEQFGPTELLQFSRLAEEAGFDSVFISDHFQPWKHHGGHAPFSLAWLGALGAVTSRITIGTSVLTPTFRYHPAVLAQAFATLGVMFPNRIVLGVGTGESLNEVPSTGMEWPEFKERFARLREAVTLMRQLWTEERVTFEGQYYRTKDATIYDRPATPVPIYVAAAGALIAKYAGRMGDGLICTSGKARELYTETILPKVSEGRAEAGSRAPDYARMIEVKVSFDTDKQRAMEDTRHWAVLALTPEEKVSVHSPEEMERLADGLSAERAASRWIVSTDPDEHVERIGVLRRSRLRPSGLSCAGSRSGAVPPALCGARSASPPSPRRRAGRNAQERMTSLEVIALEGLPFVRPGDDLVELIASALTRNDVAPRAGDVLVVAQKIVSKAEGRIDRPRDHRTLRQSPHACGGGRQGPAACRAYPVGVGSRRAGSPQRADRRAQAWLHHGECRGGPIERGAGGWRVSRASVAGESGPQRGGAATMGSPRRRGSISRW